MQEAQVMRAAAAMAQAAVGRGELSLDIIDLETRRIT
jgi:hypothetical protein